MYNVFIKYSDQVLVTVLRNLIEHADEINARGAIMMLINGKLWSHKKRDNLRMMKDFAINAIGCLERERDSQRTIPFVYLFLISLTGRLV